MNKTLKIAALMLASVLAVALAAPKFAFSEKTEMNAMMKGSTIEISAYPKAKIAFRRIAGSKATLVYNGTDAKGVFDFYAASFKTQNWKAEAMMANDSMMKKDDKMMADGTMKKDEAMMSDGAMKKDDKMMADETMKKDDKMMADGTMMKKDDKMADGTMMKDDKMMKDTQFDGRYTLSSNKLDISVFVKEGKTFVNFGVK